MIVSVGTIRFGISKLAFGLPGLNVVAVQALELDGKIAARLSSRWLPRAVAASCNTVFACGFVVKKPELS